MRIMYKYLSKPIELNGKLKILIIENSDLFRNTILELYSDNSNDMFVFSKNYKPIPFDKKIEFLGDILNLNYSDKKLITKINSNLEDIANSLYFEEVLEIKRKLLSLCIELSGKMDFDLDFADDIDTLSLIKLCSFTLKDDAENTLEKFLRFLKLMRDYLGIECFIIQNLCLYYSNACLTEFFNTIYSCGINIIDIEHTVPEIKLNSVDMVIIDKDLCIVDK